MSSKKIKKEEIIKNENNNSKYINIILLSIIVILIIIIIIIIFNKDEKNCPICDSTNNNETVIEPSYQLINYDGFRFKMPLDWNFVSNSNKYEIADKESKVYIYLKSSNMGYESFSEKDYQKEFLEALQTSDDIKIDGSEEKEEGNSNYILYFGTASSYNYLLVAIGNEEKTILINAQFVDKLSYDTLKDKVIEFAKTAI